MSDDSDYLAAMTRDGYAIVDKAIDEARLSQITAALERREGEPRRERAAEFPAGLEWYER